MKRKAFVNGVSILDSNPKAYKYVKKKMRMAYEGTKVNFGQKVGNFLNSDTGQFVINGVSQLANNIQQAKNQQKINKNLQNWKQKYIESITPKDFSQQIQEQENHLQQLYSDYNSSPIVQAYKQNILANADLAAAKQQASQEADAYIAQYQLNNTNSSSGEFGDYISQGLGLLGQYLSNKKQAASD